MKTKSTVAPANDLPADAVPTCADPADHEELINIMIVDDEPRNLTVLETVLDDPGYRLVRAESAEQALLALVAEEFALLILDIQMPGMTGFELAQMIKERKKTAHIPIIFLTAYYNEDQHVLEGYSTGAVDYLHKPVNASVLRSKVAVFAELHRTSRQYGEVNRTLLAEVTQRRRAEQQLRELNESLEQLVTERTEVLREREERFRAAALVVSDIIWTSNAQGMMEGEQPGWAQFTGQTPEEYQGYGWAGALHPEDAQPTIDAWNAAVAEKRLFEFEHRVRRYDNSWRSCAVRAVPVIGKDGETREWVGVHNDITELKRSNAELIAAKEHAEAASRAKDEFLAALSHELRTPLNPVLMAATSLGGDLSLPAEVRGQLEMMRRNIELEARLIDDLLDFTRINHGKLIIAPITADIHELLHHTDKIVRGDGLGKHLTVVLKLDADRHHSLADPARLLQVFWNLLWNAVKFTPDGGTITVGTRNDADGRILISVADNGIGIRTEVLAKIFNAFEQGDTSGEHRYGGLGLGLAISSAIVTAHGGHIRAESEGLGHGAEFTVTLASVPATAAASANNLTPARSSRALSLLIVEDHEASRLVLERLLSLSGHRVTTASTARDALTAYNSATFDVVISDLGLPDGSGIDLMVQIQTICPVPAIALSGYGMEADLRRSKEAGFFAHLVKPVKVDQLKELLSQITDHF